MSNANILKKSGKFVLTQHARTRIRQRLGLKDFDEQTEWVNESVAESKVMGTEDKITTYRTDKFEILCDGLKVVTVKPYVEAQSYLSILGDAVSKQAGKLLQTKERLFRKAEIDVAELTLNYLKARNPNVKSLIKERLINATDEKQRLLDDVNAIKRAAKQYGVSAEEV